MTDPTDPVRFDGRVAVVTGAGSGVGRAHALLLAARGASVVVNDLPSVAVEGPAELVAREIRDAGGVAEPCAVDLTSETGAARVVAAAVERFGRLDIVINNAGLLRSFDFADMTAAVFDEVIAVNLRATFLVAQAAWGVMVEQGYGRLLSTTSNSGLLGTAGSTAYAMAKAGVWGLTRSLALEGREVGINVNAIAPIAFTQMSMTSRIAPPRWRSGEGDEWAHRLDPARIAPVAAWLVHEDCQVNGEVWSAAGGRVARFFMGLTGGFVEDELTIEHVRDHTDDLLAEDDFHILPRAADEGRQLRRRLIG